jgi:hypothetical protein
MKRLKLTPKSLTWQSLLLLMLVAMLLVQVGALSLALALQEGGPTASQAIAWEPIKPPPPPLPPGGGATTNGCDWGG